ncbi:MAG: ClpXP protease specificity-enhancing factor SspB [Gammaproteobacteria bacterium]|nr:ClpXP protease specificity-enhancing factor SspB [Gammaproteobacteria bacterium]
MARLRGFLLQSTFDWIVDHKFTPYLLVNAEDEGVQVPSEYIDEGQIVLNIDPNAIQNLSFGNEVLSFDASFGGQAWQIYVPLDSVQALYANETGQGIYAQEQGYGLLVNEGESEDELDPSPAKKGPALRLVK